MKEQEDRHLAAFEALIRSRRVRPTILHPLWHVAGFALGAGTALLGERAAMACPIAVEEVIDDHYRRQAEALGEDEAALKATIRSEERRVGNACVRTIRSRWERYHKKKQQKKKK